MAGGVSGGVSHAFYLKKVTRVKHRFFLFDEIFNKKIEIDKRGRRVEKDLKENSPKTTEIIYKSD